MSIAKAGARRPKTAGGAGRAQIALVPKHVPLVKRIMAATGLRQAALAGAMGVSLDRVKSLSSGKVKKLTPEEMQALVDRLHVRPEFLATGRGEVLLPKGLAALVERMRSRAGLFDILQSFEDQRPNPGTSNGEVANLLRLGADALVSLCTLKAEAAAIRRPCAELANNAADAAGFMCRGAIARHATGEVGPDYVGMVETALQRLDGALAATPGADA